MKSILTTSILLLISLFGDIITRHDVRDEKLLEYGKHADFQSLAIFKHGNGTLIDKSWVLTAEHVTVGLLPGNDVLIGGKTFTINEVIRFPQIGVDNPYKRKDIALVKLNEEVTHVRPALLPEVAPKAGEMIHLAGTGRVGDGRSTPKQSDHRVRGATNRLDEVNDLFVVFDFDKPDSPDVTELEGISGFGDSGGPTYLRKDGKVYLAGVSSFQASPDDQTPGGHYGVREHYVNVFEYVNWINVILSGKEYFEAEIEGSWAKFEIDGEKVTPVEGSELDADQIESRKAQLLASYREFVKTSNDAANNVPRFMAFMQSLAVEANVVETARPVPFKLSGVSLMLNGKKVSDEIHQRAKALYEEYFGEKLTGEASVDYDPNG